MTEITTTLPAPHGLRLLFSIAAELQAEYEAIDESTPEDALERLTAHLLARRETAAAVMDDMCLVMTSLESEATAYEAEAARLAEIAARRRKAIEHTKGALRRFFEATGWSRLETPRGHKISYSEAGQAPVVVEVEPEQLPEALRTVKVTVAPNKDAIRKALTAGEPVVGCYLGERSKALRIK